MLKAQQELLAQEASSSLIDINNREFQYYVDFCNTLGVMFTFIAGYELSTFFGVSRVDQNTFRYVYSETFQNLYWTLSTISIFFALEGLLVSVYLVVFGQALALQGPVGSIQRAINIMKKYRSHLLLTFSATVISLGLATIAGFWYVMAWYGAAICTAVALLGMYSWHKYSVQIYNEMKFVVPPPDYNFESPDHDPNAAVDKFNLPASPRASTTNPVHNGEVGNTAPGAERTSRKTVLSQDKLYVGMDSPFLSTWRILTRFGRRNAYPEASAGGPDGFKQSRRDYEADLAVKSLHVYKDANFSNVVFDQTVDIRVLKTNGVNKWSRRYIIVTAAGICMVYRSMQEYKSSATSSVCRQFRPIELGEYSYRIAVGESGLDEVATLSPVDNYKASIELKCIDKESCPKLRKILESLCATVDDTA